ncbi:hypothetical protein ACFV6F_12395 [Kitasatospora phosalacinea]|uniref:hypothetical protein n=1 Tax=Kitasatospora phosalacinea TaxID=2065 RepID=UPI00365E5FC2
MNAEWVSATDAKIIAFNTGVGPPCTFASHYEDAAVPGWHRSSGIIICDHTFAVGGIGICTGSASGR